MNAPVRSVTILLAIALAPGCGGGGGRGSPPPPSCTVTLSGSGASASAGSETGSIGVTVGDGCAWTASSDAAWLVVIGGVSGTGNGTVQYLVQANGAALERSGTITVGGKQYTVTQAGAACAYALQPETSSFTAAAGTGAVAVDTLEGCPWTATSNDAWLEVVSGTPGSGDGSVQFSVAANTGTASRSGTLTVAGKTFTVAQGGSACEYAISDGAASFGADAATGGFDVTTQAGCAWTAGADVAWITVTSGGGTGDGSVQYEVEANPSSDERSGAVTVAGVAHTVTQSGAACTSSLLPASGSYPPEGTVETVEVSTPEGCPWSASSDVAWVTITSGASGEGPGTVSIEVAANAGAAGRSTTLSIAGESFAVTQGGAGCTYSVSPTSVDVTYEGGTGTLGVTAPDGCGWTAASEDGWLTFTAPASGSGNGSVGYTIAANADTSPREGTATVAGQTFTVTQGAAPCTYGISSDPASFSAAASSSTFSVTTTDGCEWTAVSNDPGWLTVTSGASGDGAGIVGFALAENGGAEDRTGTITAAGHTFTVTQRWGAELEIVVQ